MNDEIINDSDRLSNCCGAPMYSDTDLCSECGEHCSPEESEDLDEEEIL